MLNQITIMGRLTAAPELRRTQDGKAVVSFSLAVQRDFKDKDGNRETDFIDVVAWRQTAEFVSRYFDKGSMAVVSGRLQIRPWTDNDGNKRRSTEVVADQIWFGEPKRDNAAGPYSELPAAGPVNVPYSELPEDYPVPPELDNELPM